ncbi:MAG: murein biosynthesis integral membrane protein MurJ [Byssovorax sp.]
MTSEEDQSELVAGAAVEPPPFADEAAPAPPAKAEGPSAARSAAMVTAGIIVSRLFGLVRQRFVAHAFGTTALGDALAAAFRVGNITQNLLGEGTLSASFIPVYAKLRAEGRIKDATHFALSCLGLLILASLGASLAGVLFAPLLTRLIATGFDGERLAQTTDLVRILFPMTGLLVLSAWALGVLNAHRRFFLPYAAPVVWSLAQIAGLVVFGAWMHIEGVELATLLAYSALVGAGLQLLVLLPAARGLLGELRPRFDRKDESVREAATRLPAALLGRGVIQISGLIDTALVSFLGAGAIASFNYAQTVYLLPMSLLGTGEAAAALPEMAGETAEQNRERRDAAVRKRLGASLARVTVLTVPATLAFLLLGRELITLLLQSGSFDRAATNRVEPLLAAYGFALLGNASGRVLTTTSYAIGDAKTPARYAVYRVVASTLVALALMRFFDVMGVVLGAVIAAWVETFALGYKLRTQIGGLGLDQIPVQKTLLLGVCSVGPAYGLRWLLPESFTATTLGSAVVLAVFGAAFAVAAPGLGLFDLRALLRRRR